MPQYLKLDVWQRDCNMFLFIRILQIFKAVKLIERWRGRVRFDFFLRTNAVSVFVHRLHLFSGLRNVYVCRALGWETEWSFK